MAPKPTKTPMMASHDASNNKSNFTYPAPSSPNALIINKENTNSKEINKEITEEKPIYERSKSCFRWIVLFLSCFAMFGSYYCYDNPTALGDQMKSKYNLNNTEYNLLYSVYSIPNIILPLFGGALVDLIGAEYSILLFLTLITIGQAIFALAANMSSYPLMLVGRTIFGFGGESLCVAESALLAVYFIGNEVAFAMGLNLSLARAGSSLNDYMTLHIYNETNSIPDAFWAGVGLLVFSLFATVIMIILDRIKAKQKRKQGFIVPAAHSGEVVKLREIRDFNVLYWLLTFSCIVVYGCVLPWNNVGTQFFKAQYGFGATKRNTYLMIPYLTSAFLCPLFGYIVDRVGKRSQFLFISTSALAATHFIFAFLTDVNPLVGLILMGVAYSIYASAIWPAVALVVDQNKIGTAYGFITAVQNGGLALFPIIVGVLTKSGDTDTKYYYVEIFLFSLAVSGMIAGAMLWFIDIKTYEGILGKPSIKNKNKENKENENDNKINVRLLNDDDLDEANISLQNANILNINRNSDENNEQNVNKHTVNVNQ